MIESASRLEISNQGVEKWSDAWRRQQLARAFDMHGSFDGWRDLAQAFQKEGNYDLAIKVWEKALERNPLNSAHFENEIVRAYDTKAVHEDPVEVYEKAVEDHPTCDSLCLRLGKSLIENRDYERMIRIFEQWQQDLPTQSKFYLCLAEAYFATARFHSAIDVLSKAIQNNLREPALFRELAKCFFAIGDSSSAIRALELGLQSNVYDISLSRDIAKVFAEIGKRPVAIAQLEGALRIHPNDPDLFDDLCVLGHYHRALSILMDGLINNPRSTHILPVARAFKLKKDYARGIAVLRSFKFSIRKVQDTNFVLVLHETISDLYKEQGDHRGRIEFCQAAALEHPSEEWALTLLNTACEEADAAPPTFAKKVRFTLSGVRRNLTRRSRHLEV